MEGMSNTLTDGLDEIPNLKLKVDKARPDADPSGLSLSRPKSTWTRVNQIDFGLSGFTRAITLPTLGKRVAVHEVDVCIEGNQGAPTLKRGKIDEASNDEILAGDDPSLPEAMWLLSWNCQGLRNP